MASPLPPWSGLFDWGERGGVRGKSSYHHPSPSQRLSLRGRSPSGAEPEPAATLILPPACGRQASRGRKVF